MFQTRSSNDAVRFCVLFLFFSIWLHFQTCSIQVVERWLPDCSKLHGSDSRHLQGIRKITFLPLHSFIPIGGQLALPQSSAHPRECDSWNSTSIHLCWLFSFKLISSWSQSGYRSSKHHLLTNHFHRHSVNHQFILCKFFFVCF